MATVKNRWIQPGPHNNDDIVEFDGGWFSWVQHNTTTQTASAIPYDDVQTDDPDMWAVISKYSPDIIGQQVIGNFIPPHIDPFSLPDDEEEIELGFDEDEILDDNYTSQSVPVNSATSGPTNNNGRNTCYKCNMKTKEIPGMFDTYNVCGNSGCEWFDN